MAVYEAETPRWESDAIGALAGRLGQLYETTRDVRRVVGDAGIDPSAYVKDGPLTSVWFTVLTQVSIASGAIEAIVAIVLKDYPGDDELARAIALGRSHTQDAVVRQAANELTPAPAAAPVVVKPATPLVDRVQAVAHLRAELERSESRRGSVLMLLGDSGVGKTRLVECAMEAANSRHMVVLLAQCVAASAEPLMPLRDALTAASGRDAVSELLNDPSPALTDYLPFVRSFLHPDATGPQLGGSTGQGVYQGLAEVLLALADRRGLCLVVEDLTDADKDTLYFLEYFNRRVGTHRVVTLSTAKRDLVEPDLQDVFNKWQGSGCQVTPVAPLEGDDAAELVTTFWKGSPLAQERVTEIVRVTGGNPFFIEQFLTLMEESDGVDAVPTRVENVLDRRLARLDEDTREFLAAAAVALETGQQRELIETLAGVDGKTGRRLLRRALEARCLVEDADGGITFAQEVLRRVVYDSIGPGECLRMHAEAAKWLEDAGLLSAAAYHYDRARRPEDVVRTALAGGERAEHIGMYRTALELYERARPYADPHVIGPRLATAYLVTGRWDDAQELVDGFDFDDPQVRSLQSQLAYVHGDFSQALEHIERALAMPSVSRADALIRLADIHLHLGEFASAAKHAREVLDDATDTATAVRCHGILGAVALFGGDVDGGEREFVQAMTDLTAQPIEERDRSAYTTILGNLGFVAEVREDWPTARHFYGEALSKRREVSDARGTLQSLHRTARAEIGAGDTEQGRATLGEAQAIASSLREELEEGKIALTYAELDLRAQDPVAAIRRAEDALGRFRRSCAAFDATHARFLLAGACEARGLQRRAVEEGAAARVAMNEHGFGLLGEFFPDRAFAYSERIAGALVAYACGDALGLPWEGMAAAEIDIARAPALEPTRGWAKGATSDDTALTLLVADHLVSTGHAAGGEFMERLAADASSIRGLGPSTTQAIAAYRAGDPPSGGGNTNGALMRAFPIGWAVPLDRAEERRTWTTELSHVTHPGAEACCAAWVGAACAAWALEGAAPPLIIEIAREEAAAAVAQLGADARIEDTLSAIAAGTWMPSPDAADLDPYETLARVLWCTVTEPDLRAAIIAAVRLGGDTDTVAALVAGLLGCRLPAHAVRGQLEWQTDVQLPEDALITRLATGLAGLRVSGRDG